MTKQRGTLGKGTAWRATMGAVALFVLMGAKGEGCFNGGDPTEDDGTAYPEPPEPCPPGHHLELVCDEPGCGDDPYPYPDEPPPGWEGQGAGDPTTWLPPEPPPPQECQEICVPDQVCPEGTVEEVVCTGSGQGMEPYPGPCLDPMGCPEPPPPPEEECYSTCVPIDVCPPGEVEVWVCDEGMSGGGGGICLDPQGCQEPPPPEPGDCYPVCMPQEPVCIAWEVVCDPMDPMMGCWEECIEYGDPGDPGDPGEPPPPPGMEP